MPLPRSGPVRSEAARQAILRATVDLMTERGYDQLSIEGIAARASVGKQTIYRWWPSKGELIAECLLEGMLFGDEVLFPDTGDIRRDLTTWLGRTFALVAGEHGEGLLRSLIAAAAENADVGRRLRDNLSGSGSITDRLAGAVGTTPHLREDTPVDAVADALIGAVILRALSRTTVGPADIDRLVTAILGP